MAVTLKSDLIRDSGLHFDRGQISIRRVYFVKGITTTGGNTLVAAMNAPGLPQYGDAHPTYPSAICRAFDVNPIFAEGKSFHTSAEVIVTYYSLLPPDTIFPVVTFGSTLRQEMTDTDRDGKEITVLWDGALSTITADPTVVSSPVQGYKPRGKRAIVPKYVRMKTITFTKWFVVQANLFLNYPTPIEAFTDYYYGTVNSTPYRGGNPHEWMCTQSEASTQDYGKSYQMTVTIEKREYPDSWDEWAWFRKENGEVPEGIIKKNPKDPSSTDQNKDGDGVKRIKNLNNETDFNFIFMDMANLITFGKVRN